jgi:pyrroloquinoline quinone biosynthesis protein B|tara:strand:- start:1896 stop:2783 length:888 start_codon:yes stop_codon:yes gene_type:complete
MGSDVRVVVLGISQDGGFPQAGCNLDCCQSVKNNPSLTKHPVSMGIIGSDGSKHLIEATRDLAWQLNLWDSVESNETLLSSLWITHAHHGHIDGLGLFGKEVINAKKLNVHCSESLSKLIKRTPNWNLLVESENIVINSFINSISYTPSPNCGFEIKPIKIPHRAELSDMHAFLIIGPNKNLLFLPDHDTWESTLKFVNMRTIRDWFKAESIDFALIDGTFWSSNELVGRNQKNVPHPTVSETLKLIGNKKFEDPVIKFTHLNHTNPLNNKSSNEFLEVKKMGWSVAEEGEIFKI